MNPNEPSKNVVVLTIDQLSAGMLGPYGNTMLDTANFNRLAANSILFDFAYSGSTDLWSSFRKFWSLDGEDRRLITDLATDGVETVLISDDDDVLGHEDAVFDRVIAIHSQEIKQAATDPAATSMAAFFAQSVASLTELQPGSFVWLHSQGLRGPWDAPYSYRERFADEDDPDPPTFVESPSTWVDPKSVDPDYLLGLQQSAMAQVRLLDEFLGVLLDLRESSPVWESTLFCVMSTRGCALGEHGLIGVGDQLYNESIQVPILFCPPGNQHPLRASRSAKLANNEIIGEVSGLWMAESEQSFQDSLIQWLALPDRETEYLISTSKEQDAIQTHAWKLVRSKMGGVELYAKPDDRHEVNDVSDLCPDIVRQLLTLLDVCLERPLEASEKFLLSRELGWGID